MYKFREYVTKQQAEHMLQMKEDITNNKLVSVRPTSEIEKKETKGTTKKLRPV